MEYRINRPRAEDSARAAVSIILSALLEQMRPPRRKQLLISLATSGLRTRMKGQSAGTPAAVGVVQGEWCACGDGDTSGSVFIINKETYTGLIIQNLQVAEDPASRNVRLPTPSALPGLSRPSG